MDITVTNSPTVCFAKPIRLAPNVLTEGNLEVNKVA